MTKPVKRIKAKKVIHLVDPELVAAVEAKASAIGMVTTKINLVAKFVLKEWASGKIK